MSPVKRGKGKKVSLRGVNRELVKVKKELERQRRTATPEAAKTLDLKLKAVKKLHTWATNICVSISGSFEQ